MMLLIRVPSKRSASRRAQHPMTLPPISGVATKSKQALPPNAVRVCDEDEDGFPVLEVLPVASPKEFKDIQSNLLHCSPILPFGMQRPLWKLSDYIVVRQVYKGYASRVYQARCIRSQRMVVLKLYDLPAMSDLNRAQIYREVEIHGKLQHENIIQLYAAFTDGTKMVLVEEYAGNGDLVDVIDTQFAGNCMTEKQLVQIVLHPLLLALQHMHLKGVVHRDLKPENLLFTEDMTLKVADFGLSIDLTEENAVTRAGTLSYMAPEVLRCPLKHSPFDNKGKAYLYYGGAVDIWGLGALTYELLIGTTPFAGGTPADVMTRIATRSPLMPLGLLSNCATEFIAAALQKCSEARPTVEQMLQSPWIKSLAVASAAAPSTPTRPHELPSRNQPLCTSLRRLP